MNPLRLHKTLFTLLLCAPAMLPAQQPAAATAAPATANAAASPEVATNVPKAAATPAAAAPAAADPALSMPPSEGVGDVLQARGRYLAAIHVYEQLPPTALILNKMGIACEHMYMFDRARGNFEASLKLNPKYSEAYNNLGTLAHSQGDLKQAEKMYKKALKLKPHAANTLQNLGTLYYSQRKFKKGDEKYKEALAIDPEILERSSRSSIQTNTKAQSASEIHYHLAMTYAQAGSQKLALDYLRKAIGEGFRDRNRLLHDKEFADLRTTDVFLKMVDDLKKD
jgi:tetratricopeptide (TPR) repeat protein